MHGFFQLSFELFLMTSIASLECPSFIMRLAILWFTSLLHLRCALKLPQRPLLAFCFCSSQCIRQAAPLFCFGGVLRLPHNYLSIYSLEVCFGSLAIKGNISTIIYIYIYVCIEALMCSLCVSRYAYDANDARHAYGWPGSNRASGRGRGSRVSRIAGAEDHISSGSYCQVVQQAQSGWHRNNLPSSGLSWGSTICMCVYIYRERFLDMPP